MNMNTKSRISSILKANTLDVSMVGLQSFNLSELQLDHDLDFLLPTNIRLGHLVEKIVSEFIRLSNNYEVLYENVQIIKDKKTIGEIDFIIEEVQSKQVFHLELAYKFYLYDPNISSEEINNWIGPNRNDSLREKLEKVKTKQFPLLFHDSTKSEFKNINVDEAEQSLCLFVSLFVPYKHKGGFSHMYKNAIQGYYLNLETFRSLDNATKTYHLPSKKHWGMDPSENVVWTNFQGVENLMTTFMKEKQAPLCWQKCKGTYLMFFIIWW